MFLASRIRKRYALPVIPAEAEIRFVTRSLRFPGFPIGAACAAHRK
jgi:hypothetical protein